MTLRVSVHAPAPSAARDVVDTGLGEYNEARAPLGDVRPLHVVAESDDGTVAGGALGRTWGRCCELQQLWVAPASRGQGLGTRLMDAFEAAARARGCRLVYLDTFSFQAPGFYRDRGYVEVLRTTGFTGGVVKCTMHKTWPDDEAGP